jgi:Cu+-exporting ATPase
VAALDRWMEQYLNADEGLHWLSHRWRPVLAVLFGIGAVAYALSGLTQVNVDEAAVVRRFGRPLEADLGPGLYWRWPWPVETVLKVRPDLVRTVAIGFRSQAGTPPAPDNLTWSSPHGGDGRLRLADEAVMITGDGNLVELQASVRYTIDRADLHTYLFELREPEEVIRAAAESVLREAVASRPFLDLLTVQRGRFQDEVLDRLERRCRAYSGRGLGVRFDGFSLHDLHPPQEVVPAYHDVTKAMEVRDRLVNEAQAEAIRKHADAKAQALRLVRQAEAAARDKVRLAEAARDAFLARQRVRAQGSDQASLTDFRLYWDALGRALAGRDKVLIDSDRVPGRRQLFLFDPEPLRAPLPGMFAAPGRGSPPTTPTNRLRGEAQGEGP